MLTIVFNSATKKVRSIVNCVKHRLFMSEFGFPNVAGSFAIGHRVRWNNYQPLPYFGNEHI